MTPSPQEAEHTIGEILRDIYLEGRSDADAEVNIRYADFDLTQAEAAIASYTAKQAAKQVLEARISERTWAYTNMRRHNTDEDWVELAKARLEKLQQARKELEGEQ